MHVRSASGPDAHPCVGPDRRKSYRFAQGISEGINLELRDGTSVAVLDVGAFGARVRCNVRVDASLLRPCRLRLRRDLEVELNAQPVKRFVGDEGHVELAIRFVDVSDEGRRVLSRFLVEAQCAQQNAHSRFFEPPGGVAETSTPRFVRLLKLYAVARCETLRIYEGEQPLDRRLAVRAVSASGVDAVELGHGSPVLQDGSRYGFVACGEGSVVAFEAVVERGEGDAVKLSIPERFVQSGFRSSPRGVTNGDARPTVALRHAALSERPRIIDEVSARGFSVCVDLESEPIWPGAVIDDVELALEGVTLQARGVVRAIAPLANGRNARCGVELTAFARPDYEDIWRDRAFAWLHPSLRSGADAEPDTAWDVLESSAYVSEWTDGDEQNRVRNAYVRAWGHKRGKSGRLLLLEGPTGVAATAAGTWLHPSTWMFHHFGVDQRLRLGQRSFLAYSRELYTGALFEYRHMADQEFFTLYVERGKRWNDLMYGEFCERHPDSERLLYQPNEVFRCDTYGAPTFASRNTSVRLGEAADFAMLTRHLARTRAPLELDAMAFRREGFEPHAIRDWALSNGFERDRVVYVHDEGHGPDWAIVCESGDEGVNVFGLLNTCTLHRLSPDADEAGRTALLARAIEHYRSLSKRHVVLFEPSGSGAADACQLGFKHVSGGMHWVAHRDVMPAWLTHVRDTLAVASGRAREKRVA